MRYTDKTFAVGAAPSQEYRDNWERTFAPREPAQTHLTKHIGDYHWCLRCKPARNVRVTGVGISPELGEYLVAACPTHGSTLHDAERFCWCEK